MPVHRQGRYAPLPNTPNPYQPQDIEWEGPPPDVPVTVIEERPKTILTHNESPDVGFDWSVNPYRGCQHGCIYCYARPTHEYWDMSAGRDFERRIIVKVNAPELLEHELRTKRSWRGDPIAFSGNTDCYQPLEAQWLLTRRCLEVCAAFRNPVVIITKSHLVTRDVDVLQSLHEVADVKVIISLTFRDRELARVIEPLAAAPEKRLDAIRQLAAAGIPVGVLIAPIIPGLNDADIPHLLEAARDAGAGDASCVCLRLPQSVKDVFEAGIRERLPLRADRILHRVQDVRGGTLNEWRFGARMRGTGTYWDSIAGLFRTHARRVGLLTDAAPAPRATFRVPSAQQEFGF